MNAYHPAIAAAVLAERRSDLLRTAARSRLITDLPDRDRHQTPRHPASWWSRTTHFVTHPRVASRA
jgi:hypothetical protein